MIILGIDPGINSGAAIYNPDASQASGLRWQLLEMPTMGEGSQRRINAAALRDWIVRFNPSHAYVEGVSAFPGQGVSSGFRFGRAAGAIDATVQCCGIPITHVVSRVWKKAQGLAGSDKELDRLRAIQLFPELSSALALKKSHNIADAILIAAYGAAKHGQA